ncbi:orotidine-5'-phosphate decarboxylase [Halobacillus shinanisalinarum]|uniref:Orotidine 5'-phosphate decarboxylase n=1 Tax=Halobacillus shinanisalinarum TaxID=2932258 RepID=A0ABY4GYT4_9BACI|nr:orotidine-5'-phosphate decarboxylase [Halobacillus shinanisalinarum]UOQ93111.1 orotidine-5'-phosphate decarboxylase [Halobacillus shinanisalinarum]
MPTIKQRQLDPLYLALDLENKHHVVDFIEQNQLKGIPVKVGMELFYREGPQVIYELRERGHQIFLDLKLHDIPATVKRAMSNLAKLDVDVVNVHAQGGRKMIEAAREGLEEASSGARPLLLAVTQLTSTDQAMLEDELLVQDEMPQVVGHYAKLAKQSGADGVVCSVQEVETIKQSCGHSFLTLTPGIRLTSGEVHDQKRIATPNLAGKKSSDAIVVGRSITAAEQPSAAYQKIKEEFEYARQITRATST